MTFKIRQMNSADIEFAYECVTNEKWQSETREVFEGFLQHDPKGCFVGEVNSKRIGLCVATKYKNNGFVGELVVIDKERGKGYGKLLFDKSVEYLQSNGIKNVFLDGDLDAVPIYEKAGFRKTCLSLRFAGKIEGKENENIRSINEDDIEKICSIDQPLFGDERSYFLKRRIDLFPNYCFVYEINNQIHGYIMARPGVDVVTVGPWAALSRVDNPESLIQRLALETGEVTLRIGVLETNRKAVEAIKRLQTMEEQTPCWRMFLGDSGNLGINEQLYSIGSPAKG